MFALSLLFIYGPQSIQPVSGLSFLSLLALTCLAVGSMIGLEILSHILGANWSQVEADVLEVKEQGFEFGTSIIIRYRYQWQGHLYEGIRSLSRNRFLQEVEMLLARYSAGSRAGIRVCTALPWLSVLEPRFRYSFGFAAMIFLFSSSTGLLLALFLIREVLHGSWRETLG